MYTTKNVISDPVTSVVYTLGRVGTGISNTVAGIVSPRTSDDDEEGSVTVLLDMFEYVDIDEDGIVTPNELIGGLDVQLERNNTPALAAHLQKVKSRLSAMPEGTEINFPQFRSMMIVDDNTSTGSALTDTSAYESGNFTLNNNDNDDDDNDDNENENENDTIALNFASSNSNSNSSKKALGAGSAVRSASPTAHRRKNRGSGRKAPSAGKRGSTSSKASSGSKASSKGKGKGKGKGSGRSKKARMVNLIKGVHFDSSWRKSGFSSNLLRTALTNRITRWILIFVMTYFIPYAVYSFTESESHKKSLDRNKERKAGHAAAIRKQLAEGGTKLRASKIDRKKLLEATKDASWSYHRTNLPRIFALLITPMGLLSVFNVGYTFSQGSTESLISTELWYPVALLTVMSAMCATLLSESGDIHYMRQAVNVTDQDGDLERKLNALRSHKLDGCICYLDVKVETAYDVVVQLFTRVKEEVPNHFFLAKWFVPLSILHAAIPAGYRMIANQTISNPVTFVVSTYINLFAWFFIAAALGYCVWVYSTAFVSINIFTGMHTVYQSQRDNMPFIDLRDRDNIIAWLKTRNFLLKFRKHHFDRVQGLVAISLALTVLLSGFLVIQLLVLRLPLSPFLAMAIYDIIVLGGLILLLIRAGINISAEQESHANTLLEKKLALEVSHSGVVGGSISLGGENKGHGVSLKHKASPSSIYLFATIIEIVRINDDYPTVLGLKLDSNLSTSIIGLLLSGVGTGVAALFTGEIDF